MKLRSTHIYLVGGIVTAALVAGFISANLDSVSLWLSIYSVSKIDIDVITNITAKAQDVLTLSLSILIEAAPFLLLGTALSVLIRLFVPINVFERVMPTNRVARRLGLSFAGMLLPVCECGNVPIARTMLRKGASVGDAITFLLAAPVLNPIVLYTTWQAFRFDTTIVFGRFMAVFLIANLVALLVPRFMRGRAILTPDFESSCRVDHTEDTSFDHATRDFVTELWPLLKLLAFGAVIAGLVQVFIPRELLVAVGNDMVLGVVVMIALGFIVSICSSVDAFFALAFARTFQSGSVIAFLVSGPMVDIKMVALLRTTFTTRAIALICALVFGMTFAVGVTINYLVI